MSKGGGKKLLSVRPVQLVWVVVAVLAVLIGSAFWKAWGTNRALKNELEMLRPMVTAAAKQQEALDARLAYVQSDEYVESWARTKARMAKPGETLVIAIAPTPSPTPVPQIVETPVPTTGQAPFWLQWWQSLMGGG